jgi:hypothetical protein
MTALSSSVVRPTACTSSINGIVILPSGRTGTSASVSLSFCHTSMCRRSAVPMT